HHLKENDLAQTIVAAREALEARKGQVTVILVILLVAAAAGGGIVLWRQEDDSRAQQLLAEAMVTFNTRVIPASSTPGQPGEVPAAATIGATGSFATEASKLNAALPKLKAAAEAYPDSDAGITARYHYASSLAALGKHADAIQAFDEVVRRAGNLSLYSRMAQMGKADTQVRGGQVEAAIATWKALAESTDEELPKDAILMELGKAYQASGNQAEARKVFTRIVDEHPSSPYSAEARAELGS
ncbi:MAG: tetratricopeptide repeat protein, partial [Acidobacteria bacterium]|nr:tetratricopeptide repeat protein [Acidobacteriota bacterium]